MEISLAAGYAQKSVSPGGLVSISAMTWFGKFDEDYSLGNYVAVGATGQAYTVGDSTGWTALGELRRGMVLIAINAYAFASAGVNQTGTTKPAAAFRLGGGAAFRPHLKWSSGLRLEVGADVEQNAVPFRMGIAVTGNFWQPFKRVPKD